MLIWREGSAEELTQSIQQRHFMKYCFSLSLITQSQAFEAAVTKCATVILLEHSLIKADIPPSSLTLTYRGQPEEEEKRRLIFAYVVLEQVMLKYHLPAGGRLKLRAASSSALGQASSGER